MTWIHTYTGRAFEPLAPCAADVDIHDIGHALAMKCRFNGHCRRFYSVAEHSVRLSRLVSPQWAFEALMHDAAEAYLPDIPRTLKHWIGTWGLTPARSFRELEHEIMRIIAECFELTYPFPDEIHENDLRLLVTEGRDLMAPPPKPWGIGELPFAETIIPWSPEESEARFRQRFVELQTERTASLAGGRA